MSLYRYIVFFMPIFVVVSYSAYGLSPVSIKYIIERQEAVDEQTTQVMLPYLFATDSMGLNIGVGGLLQGYFQDELLFGGTAYKGTESYGVSAGFWNYLIPHTQRFYLTGYGFYGYYPHQTAHAGSGVNKIPNHQPLPGSHYSDLDDAIEGAGFSNWLNLKLEYVFALGRHIDEPTLKYKTRGGQLIDSTPPKEWNPFTSGSTIAMAQVFHQYQSFESSELNSFIEGSVYGLELGIQYDNTDFAPNPSYGSRQYVALTLGDEIVRGEAPWSFIELDSSHFYSFGQSKWAKQRTLAANIWTGVSPSWKVQPFADDSRMVVDAPPYNYGATLGGWNRMRGYAAYRFHDKAVLYGALEYRYTLQYNPLSDIAWFDFFQIDWFQLVPFIEVGKVAPNYALDDLLSDMKIDTGIGLRMMTAGTVVRADYARSAEGSNIWFMVSQTY